MFTIRYIGKVPLCMREHTPTRIKFYTYAEALAYCTEQGNSGILEVVKR